MDHEQAIDRLERDVGQLRVDFERFFSGALPVPPEPLRQRVHNEIRFLREANLRAAQRFRLGALEARVNALNELFNRRLRDREEGRAAVHPPPPQGSRPDPRAGVTVAAEPGTAAVESLFQELYGGAAAAQADLESFRAYLADQVSQIRERTGCTEVQFRVAEQGGKRKLKAKPMR